jgi:GntR family transcriptional regulator
MATRLSPVKLDFALDRNGPVPLWHQIAATIEAAINDGTLPPGTRLENEVALSDRLGLGRPTVRQAIAELVRKGLLARKQGVGTQVVHFRRSRDSRQMSLYDDLARAGQHPSTRLLEWSTGPLDEPTRARLAELDVDADQDFVHVRRLRLADGVPLAILDNQVPAAFELTPEDVAERGLYGALRALGVNPKIAHQTVGARQLLAPEAKLFTEKVGSPALTVERLVHDDTGRFVEFGQHVYRASQYSIEMTVVG